MPNLHRQRLAYPQYWHSFEARLPLGSGKPARKQTREAQINRRLELLGIVLALGAAVVGGITSSLADEAQIEVGVGELRGEILSLFAPRGCRSDGNEPKLQERCGARACGSSLAGRRGLAELQQNADFRALLRPQPDQLEERREAEGAYALTTPDD